MTTDMNQEDLTTTRSGGVPGLPSVELDWYAESEQVTVTPRSQRRFEISKDRAIEVLQVAEERRIRFDKQFSLLLYELAEWIHDHEDQIETPYLTIQDGSLMFVVVRNDARLDLEFEDDLSALDFRLANDPALDLIRLHTMSLPPTDDDSLQSFLFEPFTISYHGLREGSRSAGE